MNEWRPIEVRYSEVADALSSNRTTKLEPEHWPDSLTDQIRGVTQVHAYRFDDPREEQNVPNVAGTIDVSRKEGGRHKHYRFYYAKAEGQWFRFGPDKDLDYGHYTDERPDLE